MLPHENQMFLDVASSDGCLLIAAKGLGVHHVLANLIKVYSEPGNLVLILGSTEVEEDFLIANAEDDDDPELKVQKPRRITATNTTSDRQKIYKEGGVLFVTTRILVVDMLKERIPINLITGIIVCHAHRIANSCQDSFVLRLFREKNKTGFIKAFSSTPVAFKAGFAKIDRVMRSLFVRELFLWPRFRSEVNEGLAEASPEVVELHLELTKPMTTIQTALLDLINFSMQELKRVNPSLETYDELTVENALGRTFHKVLQTELDPIWHQLSWKTKQLVADIKTLRTILTYLTQYDCISFHAFVSALRTTENATKSGWMLLDAAENLFVSSKRRVFGDSGENQAKEDFGFEENPKWKMLLDILDEIKDEVAKHEAHEIVPSQKVLVLTHDDMTAKQLQDLISLGKDTFMKRLFNKCLGDKYGHVPEPEAEAEKEKKHKGVGKKSAGNQDQANVVKDALTAVKSPVILIQSMRDVGFFEINKMIYELRPRYFVMYDTDVSLVRQLEVFQAKNSDFKIRVYFLMFDKSVEEQAYLTELRKEKEAFEHLMKEKATMVIPEEREGKTDGDNPDLIRDPSKASDAIMQNSNSMTRKGGGSQNQSPSRIIVDMREFRSELPPLIHKRGIDIEPVTIEVGDYILTPEICVERKSISDLIGSLQNGRLYNQATNMTRFYAKPMLLIEFDQNKPFALQGRYYLSRDISNSDITAKLQLLTIHFPKLRILWSPSPHATAELFEELKQGREEPDAAKAASMTMDVVDDYNVDRFNPKIFDFVSKLPGITTKNIYGILNRAENLADLLNFSRDELSEILESSHHGQLLYSSLHEHVEKVTPGEVPKRKRPTNESNQRRGVFKSKRSK